MDKMCAFPDCEKIAESRGHNSITGKARRRKWCKYHQDGEGKEERRKLFPPEIQQPSHIKGERKIKRNKAFVNARRIQHDERYSGLKKPPIEKDPNINYAKVEQFRKESMYGR